MSNLETSLQLLAERGTPAGSDELRRRVAIELAGSPARRSSPVMSGWAIAAAVAAASIVLIGGASVLLGGSDGSVAPQPPAKSISPVTTTIEIGPEISWHPILIETVAGDPPTPATCPPDADPNRPGPSDQARPGEGPWNNQAAVFDVRTGRIVFIDVDGETWTFDVCTNTWQRMEPEGSPTGDWVGTGLREHGELVYDVDSDRTISFGPHDVSVYDASTNTWTNRPAPPHLDLDFGWPGFGAVYDPITGLVLVLDSTGILHAYDVDSDRWTAIGSVIEPREITSEGQTQQSSPPFLVGYVAETDRLALVRFSGAPFQGLGGLLDPRTGEITPLDEPEGGISGGFGRLTYATGGDTASVFGGDVCSFEPATSRWTCTDSYDHAEVPSAMVHDTMNDRIVVVTNHCCNWPGSTVTDGVYSVDVTAHVSLELLAAAHTRIAE